MPSSAGTLRPSSALHMAMGFVETMGRIHRRMPSSANAFLYRHLEAELGLAYGYGIRRKDGSYTSTDAFLCRHLCRYLSAPVLHMAMGFVEEMGRTHRRNAFLCRYLCRCLYPGLAYGYGTQREDGSYTRLLHANELSGLAPDIDGCLPLQPRPCIWLLVLVETMGHIRDSCVPMSWRN
jgi:hypothetical protein